MLQGAKQHTGHYISALTYSILSVITRKRRNTRRRMCLTGVYRPWLELDASVQEWTETKSGPGGWDRGGNPLSAKLCSAGMYSRLFARVTWLATAQRAVRHRQKGWERCGENKMDLVRERRVENKRSCTSSHRSFFMFSQFKMYVCPLVPGEMLTYDTLLGDVRFPLPQILQYH